VNHADMPSLRIGDLPPGEFEERIDGGLGIEIGPFSARLDIREMNVARLVGQFYRDHAVIADDNIFSLHATLDPRRSWRPWRRPMVRFTVDGRTPHEDMPAPHGFAVLEWGMNLVIAMRFHGFLMLHSAVVEKGGYAMLLPAAPGFGKTTLCAALSLSGWRLFSDEFGLVRPGTTDLIPLPRPLALKNESIRVIRDFQSGAEIGPEIEGTRKGTVAHLKPPKDSVYRNADTAAARWIVYPKWQADAQCRLEEIPPVHSFMLLATNAFNYEMLGEAGFDTVRRLIDTTRSYRLVYSKLEDALDVLSTLIPGDHD